MMKVNKFIFLGLACVLSSCQADVGEGIMFMIYMFMLYFVLIIAIFIFFIRQLKEKKKRSNLSIWQVLYQRIKLPVLVILSIGISIFAVNTFLEGRNMKTVLNELELKEFKELKKPKFWDVKQEQEILRSANENVQSYQKDSTNDWVFVEYVQGWIGYENNPYRASTISWKSHLEGEKDQLRKAIISYYDKDSINTFQLLDGCDKKRIGVNYFYGKLYFDQNLLIEAENYFLKEIDNNGWNKKSLNYLKKIYQKSAYVVQVNKKQNTSVDFKKIITKKLMAFTLPDGFDLL